MSPRWKRRRDGRYQRTSVKDAEQWWGGQTLCNRFANQGQAFRNPETIEAMRKEAGKGEVIDGPELYIKGFITLVMFIVGGFMGWLFINMLKT